MKKETKNKILIAILIVTLFNFILSTPLQAFDGGDLFAPIARVLYEIADFVMDGLHKIFWDDDDISDTKESFIEDDSSTFEIRYSPAIIFSGNVPALDVNFFNPKWDDNNKYKVYASEKFKDAPEFIASDYIEKYFHENTNQTLTKLIEKILSIRGYGSNYDGDFYWRVIAKRVDTDYEAQLEIVIDNKDRVLLYWDQDEEACCFYDLYKQSSGHDEYSEGTYYRWGDDWNDLRDRLNNYIDDTQGLEFEEFSWKVAGSTIKNGLDNGLSYKNYTLGENEGWHAALEECEVYLGWRVDYVDERVPMGHKSRL